MTDDVLDAAYERLRSTGPEFDGWLSNHGPMAAEALVRHGHADDIDRWLDGYCRRLESAPGAASRIDDWRSALGDPCMLGAWLAWFDEQLQERPWTEVLSIWWPRLIPGIAAGATHGVIRVGHTVRVLREAGQTSARLGELAQGLGYWAARWQPVPRLTSPSGALRAGPALQGVPTIDVQSGGVRSRLAQLAALDGWEVGQQAMRPVDDAEEFLRDLVSAAVLRYSAHAHADPVMLVHSATAPNAVLRTLPSLPPDLWPESAAVAWCASAALTAAYASRHAGPAPVRAARSAEDAFAMAVSHGDEHVIKLADTALDVHAWNPDGRALAAIEVSVTLIPTD